jgi:hypothetical protein
VKTLRLHLWREWREHRATLLFLALALPLLSGLAALRLPRRFVGDPWMACSLMATFVAVVLAAVGGELLGRERRGAGLRWLERLPGGLGQAFAAKLGLHLVTSAVAGMVGFTCAQTFSWLRGRGDFLWTNELEVTLPLVAILSAWTFACSAWALRGGTAILAAALVLGLGGYPVWHVLGEGYRAGTTELCVGTGLAVLAGLVAAALAFVRGSRRGAGAGQATVIGLLPVLPLAALGGIWSLARLEQRVRLEPAAGDLAFHLTWVTEDGKTAFVAASHRDPNWESMMPVHVLRVDLATGEWSSVVRDLESHLVLSSPREIGLMHATELVLNSNDPPQELVLSLLDGSTTKRSKDRTSWHPVGLGQWQWKPGWDEGRFFDPFRMRTYPESEVERSFEESWLDVFICPGRWLVEAGGLWHLYDPDTREQEPLDLPQSAQLLALLPDGRALFEHFEGILCLDPTTGLQREVAQAPDTDLFANDYAFRAPGLWREFPMSPEGPVLLSGYDHEKIAWYVLDPETLTLRAIEVQSTYASSIASFPDGRLLVENDESLVELDLCSDARRTIFPAVPAP